ncbi:uncharacterized protein [Physcomitrium patens]|uniref:uncharacterized protein n=1 Tax=Physcomitrium patens TaxID=3218 RepID=UPI00024ADA50
MLPQFDVATPFPAETLRALAAFCSDLLKRLAPALLKEWMTCSRYCGPLLLDRSALVLALFGVGCSTFPRAWVPAAACLLSFALPSLTSSAKLLVAVSGPRSARFLAEE